MAMSCKKGILAQQVYRDDFTPLDLYKWLRDELIPKMNAYPKANSVLVVDGLGDNESDALLDLVRINSECLILGCYHCFGY